MLAQAQGNQVLDLHPRASNRKASAFLSFLTYKIKASLSTRDKRTTLLSELQLIIRYDATKLGGKPVPLERKALALPWHLLYQETSYYEYPNDGLQVWGKRRVGGGKREGKNEEKETRA
jgi:hypothetical protein